MFRREAVNVFDLKQVQSHYGHTQKQKTDTKRNTRDKFIHMNHKHKTQTHALHKHRYKYGHIQLKHTHTHTHTHNVNKHGGTLINTDIPPQTDLPVWVRDTTTAEECAACCG